MGRLDTRQKIYIAGHRGLVGSAIVRKFQSMGFNNIIAQTREELDLLNQADVADFFAKEKPDIVVLAAAKVGGIQANDTYRADFIYENLQVQNNVIHSSYLFGVKRLLFLGSSCIYPKLCPQPIKEEYLLTGELEPTNEPYAIAKIAGLKMCESYNRQYGTRFISVMPTNLYGPNDNYNLETSHVLPAMIRKFRLGVMLETGDIASIKNNFIIQHISEKGTPLTETEINRLSKTDVKNILKNYGISNDIYLWGSGTPRREFLHVDDLADACAFLLSQNDDELDAVKDQHLNVGVGNDISIKELALLIKDISQFKGDIHWDTSKPDGTPQKLLDVSRINKYGWQAKISLKDGIYALFNQKSP